MLSINVLCVGKIKENYLKEALLEYSKRVSKYCNLNIIEVQDEKVPDKLSEKVIENIKGIECEKICKYIKKDTCLIALDLKGKELSSEEFSKEIENISLNYSSITFVIGGTLGISNKILNQCDKRICFSKMTFPHQLIRVFLLEQIFRGFKISNGETYQHWSYEIKNSLEVPYSNGPIEGTNNKIKALKRTTYGMPNFTNFKARIMLLS